MRRPFRNWQWVVVLLLGCAPSALPTDAGVEVDAGTDAGVADAGQKTLTPTWAPTTAAPGALWGTVLSFDPVGRRFLLHGGNTYPAGGVVNDTWSFSIADKSWTKLTTTGDVPPLRYCHCAVYLPEQHQVLIAGGRDTAGTVDSAYTLDLTTLAWTKVTGTVPTNGIGCTAHWLPAQSRAIVFAGEGRGGLSNDTWAWDPVGRTFELRAPATRPPARRDGMSIFEPVGGKLYVFGGAVSIAGGQYLDDVAIYDGTTWVTAVPPAPRPAPRRYGASGYDAVHQRWLLFSGTNDTDDLDDLWVIDPVTFVFDQVQASGPPRRGFAASAIDESDGTLYVFGGLRTPGFGALSDGWTLKLIEN